MNLRRDIACVALIVVLGVAGTVCAAPVWDKVFEWRQSNGALIQVRVWGDEYYRIVESVDGYTLVLDSATGDACYAELSRDGTQLLSTGIAATESYGGKAQLTPHLRQDQATVRAHVLAARAKVRMEKAAAKDMGASPWQGNTRGICLLVDFSDRPATIPPSEVERLCNEPGYADNGNNGSVRDYFYEVSYGQLTYTNYVPPTYHRASKPKSYYDDPLDVDSLKAKELIREALQALADGGFDFQEYGNGDTIIDAVNCFYAGPTGSPWSTGLWPHSSSLLPLFEVGGLFAGNYQITNLGSILHIGTFCHENGHMVCSWPDLYDYGYDSTGVGAFCLMGYGNFDLNPVQPCAYLKDLAGWSATQICPAAPSNLSAIAGSNVVYKFPHPTNPNEYYMIENRQQTGRDARLPDAGLAIWHCDRLGSNNDNEQTLAKHFEVTLVQADGQWHMEHDIDYGDVTDFWKSPAYTFCGPDTMPNTAWWDGAPSYLRVSSISASAPTMTFRFRGPGGVDVDTDGDGLSDYDETRDLDPTTPGIQNPFDPEDGDVTGNNGSLAPDGILDGDNDFDGDGTTNAAEFRAGTDPFDPASGLPVDTAISLAIAAASVTLSARLLLKRSGRT